MTAPQFWRARMSVAQPYWWDETAEIIRTAEPRRPLAKFNTGSISLTAAVALWALSVWVQPQAVIEVGTFIGVSTYALHAPQVYTCDVSNDCLPSTAQIACFPYRTSTEMLTTLVKDGIRADLCFFDGLLSADDVPLILRVSTPRTVYVFDDYDGQFKGVKNVDLLQPQFKNHVLFPADGPVKVDTTLAVLVPESRL